MGLVLSNGGLPLQGLLLPSKKGILITYLEESGVIVVGLVSLIIGEVIFKSLSLAERLVTIVVGSILLSILSVAVIALALIQVTFVCTVP